MVRFFLRDRLSKLLSQVTKATASTGRRSHVPTLELLEDRTVPALVGSEFHVNTTTSGNQFDSANASSTNGMSVVVWSHQVSSSNHDIRAQLYNAAGNEIGGEIVVIGTNANQFAATVAMDNFGNWIVAWTEGSTTTSNIRALRFSSSGAQVGSVFNVATTAAREYEPSIASSSNGDFVVSYTSASAGNHNVLAKLFTSAGTLLTTINVANTSVVERRSVATRSTSPNGPFAIAYESNEDILLKRYSASGTLLGSHTIASGTSRQIRPSASMNDFGQTVVAWQVLVSNQWNLLARKVGSDGVLSNTFTIANSASHETEAAVAMRSDGRFVVGFEIGTSVFVREMASNGSPLSGNLLVAATNTANALPAISIDGSTGIYLITYTALNRPSDSSEGIFGRRGNLV